MATLTVWRFDTPDGADLAARRLDLHDAAVVRWETGSSRPQTRRLGGSACAGTLGEGFWGLLFGLVFFVPLLGAAIGTTTGALAGALTDVGIDDLFINRVRDQVTPGRSALFLLTSDAVADRVRGALADGPRPLVIATALDDEQEAALRAVFDD